MKVLKFGGTSVGSVERIKEVAKLITDGERNIVVLSAMSGTTNTLVEISNYLSQKNPEGANEIINKLEAKYKQTVDSLYSTDEYKQKALGILKTHFDELRLLAKDMFTLFEEKVVLSKGELLSTNLMQLYLNEQHDEYRRRDVPQFLWPFLYRQLVSGSESVPTAEVCHRQSR